jgi:hypothetical protein
MNRQWMYFFFDRQRKSTKKKARSRVLLLQNAVVGQRQYLPQHYQCCMRRGYVRVLVGSAEDIFDMWAVA